MSDRLKQIWSGFSETTERHLTGKGVENVPVPHRTDYSPVDEASLPEGFSTPAQAAFSSLRDNLAKKERLFSGKKKNVKADAALPNEAEDFVAATAFSAAGDDLIRGLRATALRTERPELDYNVFLSSKEGKAHFKKHKRKKFLGIF
ncbi:MAG: hypothetical protein CMI63_00940 [Parvularcula sp.]|uniref:hypothetical protein n=1 Tax=Hyphococcus sp. TaxID=2038636 RepID=UPI000C3760BB|nr:hypothetical protein [Parvularcula sp.]